MACSIKQVRNGVMKYVTICMVSNNWYGTDKRVYCIDSYHGQPLE